ncbi:MAG: hypothetical protein ACRCWR_13430 [Saezia sp.]
MPVVPKNQLQVGMTSDPHVRADTPMMRNAANQQTMQMGQAAQNFGAQIGDAVEKMTGKPTQTGAQDGLMAMMQQMQQEANQTRVQDAVNKATVTALDLTHGEKGYKHLQGEAAMNRPDGEPLGVEYTKSLRKEFEGIESTLGNSTQKQAFKQWAGQYQNQFNKGLFKHEAEQAVAYETNVLRDTVGAQEKVLAYDWDKPEVVEGALGTMSAAFIKMKKLQGTPDEQIEGLYQGFVSGVHHYVINQALQNQSPEYAHAYVEQYSSQMTPEVLGTVQKAVAKEVNIKVAKNVANTLFAINPDMNEQQMLQALAAMPEIAEHPQDMERMELVKADIIAKQRAKVEQERELRETSMVQVQKALQESGGNWLALPPAVRSALPKDIEPYAKAYAKSLVKPVKISSADAYLHLSDVSALTGMSDASFEMMRTALNEEDFDFYATQRAAYKEAQATGKGVKNMPAVLNMVEVNKQMDGILGMLKIKTKPEEMSKFDKAKVSAIRKVFNKALLESQMTEGKSYTKEEVANKLSEFVAEQVLKRSTDSGLGAGKTAVKSAMGRDIFTVQASDISEWMRVALTMDLAQQGIDNPTEDQIVQAYLENQMFVTQKDSRSKEIAADILKAASASLGNLNTEDLNARLENSVRTATGGGGYFSNAYSNHGENDSLVNTSWVGGQWSRFTDSLDWAYKELGVWDFMESSGINDVITSDGFVNASAGFGDGILATMSFGVIDAHSLRQRWEIANVDNSNIEYNAGYLMGMATALSVAYYSRATAWEMSFGKNFRIAPWGHAGGAWFRQLPHFHRRGGQIQRTTRSGRVITETIPGQGVSNHRPWEGGF